MLYNLLRAGIYVFSNPVARAARVLLGLQYFDEMTNCVSFCGARPFKLSAKLRSYKDTYMFSNGVAATLPRASLARAEATASSGSRSGNV